MHRVPASKECMNQQEKKLLAKQRNAASAKKCRKRRTENQENAIKDAIAKAVALSKKLQLLLNLIEAGSDKNLIAKARIVVAAEENITLQNVNDLLSSSETSSTGATTFDTLNTFRSKNHGAECDLSSLPPLFLPGEHAAHEPGSLPTVSLPGEHVAHEPDSLPVMSLFDQHAGHEPGGLPVMSLFDQHAGHEQGGLPSFRDFCENAGVFISAQTDDGSHRDMDIFLPCEYAQYAIPDTDAQYAMPDTDAACGLPSQARIPTFQELQDSMFA
jgi:hypothetical protein